MAKARKVYTPGSVPDKVRKVGRPRKAKETARGARTPYRKYSLEKLRQAVAAIKSKNMSMNAAAIHYKIPKATLHGHVKERL